MRISVVVVSHNTRKILHDSLTRLSRHYPQAQLIVVDSGSSDGSRTMVKDRFPSATLIECTNQGYAHAVNLGLAECHSDYVVEMNADVLLEPGDLEALQQTLEKAPRAAFAGPVLTDQAGKLQNFGPFYTPNYWRLRGPRPVGWLSGALIMAKKSALSRIGPMDERFFFYNEDLEWCVRARKAGFQVLLAPRRVVHLGGASTPKDPRVLAEGYRGGLLFSRIHHPRLHGLHTKAVLLEAQLRIRLDPDPGRREAYALLITHLHRGELDQPFLS